MNKQRTFNQFWKLYPRKIAKLVAERSWKRLSNKDIESIFKVLHEHLVRWKYKDIQYVPHASTWLNQRRWEDELEPIPDKKSNPIYKNIEKERKKFITKIKSAEENMASDDERKKALGLKK
tara:strand:- start:193 stop:555 length:363 start_codon:yes stop_codon:yes gene_type:complete